MSEQRINKTYMKAMEQINNLQKVFRKGGKLEEAIMAQDGDISSLNEVNRAFTNILSNLQNSYGSQVNPTHLTEGVLDGDDEDGFMARSQLYFMARDAIKLHGMIDDRDDLEPWVHSKIVASSEAIDSVRRYMEYNSMKDTGEAPMDMPTATQPDMEMPQEAMYEDPSKPNFPITVKLAGDSIWDENNNPAAVTVTNYAFDKDEEGDINITVEHDGPWSIYSDTGFEKAISDMIGHDVNFSEQGMQRDGKAHLEGNSDVDEGYKILPPMDDKYQPRDGLEGPFSTLSGKVVYYDPKMGSYYDSDTDMYISNDEFQALDKDYSNMSEGKSPHKKGTKKYKDHMAAMHAESKEEFKPHMMYDPKTGEGKMAHKEKDHLDMKDKGWGHDKPKKVDEATAFNDSRNNDLKTIAKDIFSSAKSAAKKKAKKS